MLIDHADAKRVRIMRRIDSAFAPVYRDLPGGWLVETDQAFHQRALTGPVLAQQRMEGSRRHMHRHVVECCERTEALGHAGNVYLERMVEHDLVLGSEPHHFRFGHQAIALITAADSATAPNTPPCIVTIFSAAR